MEGFCDSVSAGKFKKDAQISVTGILAVSAAHLPFCEPKTLPVSSSQSQVLYTDFYAKPVIYKLCDSHLKLPQMSSKK